MKKTNPHHGSDFDDFLKEEGILEEVEAVALKRVLVFQINKIMEEKQLTRSELAREMGTPMSQIDRLLDPENDSVTLRTLLKAAKALGKRLEMAFA